LTLLNNIFTIEFPSIRSAGLYYFNTTSGLRYEVRFGRRQEMFYTQLLFLVSLMKSLTGMNIQPPIGEKFIG